MIVALGLVTSRRNAVGAIGSGVQSHKAGKAISSSSAFVVSTMVPTVRLV